MYKEKTIHTFSAALLFLSIFMCYGEILSLFTGQMAEVTIIYTPFWVKGIKDIGFVVLSVIGCLFFDYNKKSVLSLFCYFAFMGILFFVSFFNNMFFAFSGLRWILPLTAGILIYPYVNKDFLTRLSYCLIVIFCFHFFIQLLQIYFRADLNISGLKNRGLVIGFLDRSPGIFFMPNTSSFFSILTWFFASNFLPDKGLGKLKYLIPVSILLNKSGTGYVAFLCIIMFEKISNVSWKIVAGAIVVSILVLLGLEHFLSRPGIIMTSLGDRIAIFIRSFSGAELFSTQFGYGSITAVLLAKNFNISEPVPILDSTWSAMVVNCGLIPFLFFCAMFLFATYLSYKNERKDIFIFLFILFCYGSTNSLFEAFPMNFLCALLGIFYFQEIRIILKSPPGEKGIKLHEASTAS